MAVSTALLARAEFMNGKKGKAVETQKKAIELADDEELKTQMQGTLQSYIEGRLPDPPVFRQTMTNH